ncbi:MAG TPA: glycosyltransferase [Candidatus Sulfotelmatobacter sp.]|nr:glycosyltransferase [Candidatus Sulfotelmatobacter sp.]
MRLETKFGFRSSFNFVPEGQYRVPEDLRTLLTQSGFEVGVHGLDHDGKLYRSKTKFARDAARIQSYIRLWKASGFRSPLMQHELGWLHKLELKYDASTFDTDPFEPQCDGVGTIFPFWVANPDGMGYVELPYTLVQDFTLFKVLQQSDISIWKRKLDWIASRGGMALLNTHPDYMCFTAQCDSDQVPSALYEEFLTYVRDNYQGSFWSALPKDVAKYYCESLPVEARNTRRRVCMVAYTFYELDNRVRRYAESLVKRGDQVDVIALSGSQFKESVERFKGVTVYRVQHREYNEVSKWTYARRLTSFLVRASVVLSRLHKHHRYDVIHVHNMPDFLVFAAWYPKLRGAKVILDIHDIVPELFRNKFKTQFSLMYERILKGVERVSAAFADHVIVSNDLWRNTLVQRSVDPEKCSVFINHVDLELFYPRHRNRTDNTFIVLFPGSLQWHQGLDIAIEAFAKFHTQVPSAEFHIYSGGGGDMKSSLMKLAETLKVAPSVKFFDGVPLDEMPQVIANADLGVVPKRADSFGNEAYSTKIMEFMSQGLPVVASRTRIDEFYFNDGTVHFFESGNSGDMARAMLDVFNDKLLRANLVARGSEYSERNSWDHKKEEYLRLIDLLSTESFDNVQLPENSALEHAVSEAGGLDSGCEPIGQLPSRTEK